MLNSGPMDEINRQVSERLKRLRQARRLTLEALAERSGVSRAMLSQIETNKANPTIAMLWRVSKGLGVPFSELLGEESPARVRLSRKQDARTLRSADGTFRSRPLLGRLPGHDVELYLLQFDAGAREDSEPHPPGAMEQVYVVSGRLGLAVEREQWELGPGDALLFPADRPHEYTALGKKTCEVLSLILYG